MMGCKAEIPISNPFVTPKIGSILELLTNDTQGGKIQSGKEVLNGFKRVIWEIPVSSGLMATLRCQVLLVVSCKITSLVIFRKDLRRAGLFSYFILTFFRKLWVPS